MFFFAAVQSQKAITAHFSRGLLPWAVCGTPQFTMSTGRVSSQPSGQSAIRPASHIPRRIYTLQIRDESGVKLFMSALLFCTFFCGFLARKCFSSNSAFSVSHVIVGWAPSEVTLLETSAEKRKLNSLSPNCSFSTILRNDHLQREFNYNAFSSFIYG